MNPIRPERPDDNVDVVPVNIESKAMELVELLSKAEQTDDKFVKALIPWAKQRLSKLQDKITAREALGYEGVEIGDVAGMDSFIARFEMMIERAEKKDWETLSGTEKKDVKDAELSKLATNYEGVNNKYRKMLKKDLAYVERGLNKLGLDVNAYKNAKEMVMALQQGMIDQYPEIYEFLTLNWKTAVDGIYGPRTARAVRVLLEGGGLAAVKKKVKNETPPSAEAEIPVNDREENESDRSETVEEKSDFDNERFKEVSSSYQKVHDGEHWFEARNDGSNGKLNLSIRTRSLIPFNSEKVGFARLENLANGKVRITVRPFYEVENKVFEVSFEEFAKKYGLVARRITAAIQGNDPNSLS